MGDEGMSAAVGHPSWCEDDQRAHPPSDPVHRGGKIHAECQQFEVGIAVGVCQWDEVTPQTGQRSVSEPKIEIVVDYRVCDQRITFGADLDEARQLLRLLEKAISDCEHACDEAAVAGLREGALTPLA
jgi:hypothetical protein